MSFHNQKEEEIFIREDNEYSSIEKYVDSHKDSEYFIVEFNIENSCMALENIKTIKKLCKMIQSEDAQIARMFIENLYKNIFNKQ